MKSKWLAVSLLGASLLCMLPAAAGASAGDKKDAKEPVKKEEPKEETFQFEGKLTRDDPKDKIIDFSPHKVHVVKLKASVYQVDLTKKDLQQTFDPYLRIEDSEGTVLEKAGGVASPRITVSILKEGDYRIVVAAFAGMGDYQLKVVSKTNAGIGPDGFTIKGVVVVNSPPPQYKVRLEANKTYVIDMVTGEFDAYLVLQDAQGRTVAQDDDSGGNLNARIRYQPTASGEFVITARPLGGGRGGNFTLTVRQEK